MKFSIRLSTSLLFVFASAITGSGVGYGKLYLFHVSLIIFFFMFVSYFSLKGKVPLRAPNNVYIYFLYFMFIWYFVGSFWSVEPVYTIKYLYYLAIGIMVVVLIYSYAYNRYKYFEVFKVTAFVFIIAILIALLEVFTEFRLPTSPYSSYATLFGRKATDFLQFDPDVQSLIKLAPTSFWGNPNDLAVAMALIIPYFFMHKNIYIKVVGSFAVVLIVIMAGSRGVVLSLMFGFFVYLFVIKRKYFFPLFFGMLMTFVFVDNLDNLKKSDNKRVSELAWSGYAVYVYLFGGGDSLNSIGERRQLIKNGLDALLESDGLGVGGGASVAIQERQGGVAGKITSMHNFWIEVLVESGVLFFLLFMIWYLSLCYQLYRIFRTTKDNFYHYHAGSLLTSMTLFLVAAVSSSSVIYFLPMWLMYGMAIALVSVYRKEKKLYKNYESIIACRS